MRGGVVSMGLLRLTLPDGTRYTGSFKTPLLPLEYLLPPKQAERWVDTRGSNRQSGDASSPLMRKLAPLERHVQPFRCSIVAYRQSRYARYSARRKLYRQLSTNSANWVFEIAPTLVSTALLSLKRISVGMPRMPNFSGTPGFESTSTLQTLSLPAY